MCDQCRSILERYDDASIRLTDAANALAQDQPRPNFDALTEYMEVLLQECRQARWDLDRHRAETHHWNPVRERAH